LIPLASGFKKYLMGVDDISLEDIRDIIRERIYAKHPTEFLTSATRGSVARLAVRIFHTNTTSAFASVECTQCDYEEDLVHHKWGLVLHKMSNC
jgi:hypothetical protein